MPAPLGQQACAPHRTGGRRHPDLVRPTGPPRGSPGGRPARARTAPRRPRDGAVAQQHRLRHRLLRPSSPPPPSRPCHSRPRPAEMPRPPPSLRAVVIDGGAAPHVPGAHELATLDGDPQEWAEPSPGDTALLLLSGGTTGVPKLIPRTHADYAYTFTASADLCGLDESTVYLAVLPVAHNFTLACPGVLGTLAQGGTVVLSRTASCDEAMPLIERERVTHLALVPPLAQLWVQAREWEDSDLSSLRLVQVGGSRLAPLLARRLPQALGCRLQQVFGMAEGLLCYTRLDDPEDAI